MLASYFEQGILSFNGSWRGERQKEIEREIPIDTKQIKNQRHCMVSTVEGKCANNLLNVYVYVLFRFSIKHNFIGFYGVDMQELTLRYTFYFAFFCAFSSSKTIVLTIFGCYNLISFFLVCTCWVNTTHEHKKGQSKPSLALRTLYRNIHFFFCARSAMRLNLLSFDVASYTHFVLYFGNNTQPQFNCQH